jgi:hypothetical protein
VSEQSFQCLLTGSNARRLDRRSAQCRFSAGPIRVHGSQASMCSSGGEDEPRSTPTEQERACLQLELKGSEGLALGGIAR